MADNIFPSVAEINNQFFGGSTSIANANQSTIENKKQQENIDKNKQNQNSQIKDNNQDVYKENSIKALKEIGFETKDNKVFLRKIKNFDIKIEIP